MDALLELDGGDFDDELRIHRLGDAAAGDAGNDSEFLDHGQPHQFQRIDRERAIHIDAPHEPPIIVLPAEEGPNGPTRLRKKRSFYTMIKPSPISQSHEPEMCLLMANVTRAMYHVREDRRGEFFANYMVENMTSQNYPNGVGLPQHWGQF
ncbi:male-specific protein scotti [Drosophila eugracilis]|uniref:male-specific protein scotti n=1 Tax=Drosophila eugracilis TaxID=29029 RepID=UPI001BDA15E7|nr:male-specific protein scotti [Drosophila eugracilis]